MRLEVAPRTAEASPDRPVPITLTITNTGTVIGGYQVRVLGADPNWVSLPDGQISLFPDESTTLTAVVTVPVGITAGPRRIAIQVHELTPPFESAIAEVDLTIPAAPAVAMRVDPPMVLSGRSASFSVLVENRGNTVLRGFLDGEDEEAKVRFHFSPSRITLAPGEHTITDLSTRARRRIFGSPTARALMLHLEQRDEYAFLDDAEAGAQQPPADRTPLAQATMMQRPLVGRGVLSLLGLLAAITVFAVIITLAMSKLVGQSAADRDLAIQVAQARDLGTLSGTSAITGTVTSLTSGKPVGGVSVAVFATSNSSVPVTTTATDPKGNYRVSGLMDGDYKLNFRGAGFVALWFPGATTDTDATVISLGKDDERAGINIAIGGAPATIKGTIAGDDVAGATLYLRATPGSPTQLATRDVATLPDDGNAVVQTIPIGSDGSFTIGNVPSPHRYQILVAKPGYATATAQIDVGAGETRTGIQIRLQKGDGSIAGSVNWAGGPLDKATIVASNGQTTASTVSLTDGGRGTFTIDSLPTPGTYTLTVSRDGYASQTLTVTLGTGQKLKGVAVTLVQSSAGLGGKVSIVKGGGAAGVTVTITDGQLTLQTQTRSSGDIGSWAATGLPVPGQYTLTFSRPDLASQTLSVSLDAGGNLIRDPRDTTDTITSTGALAVAMQSATAVVHGVVVQKAGSPNCQGLPGLGEATVTLNSGTTSYAVTTASTKDDKGVDHCGEFRLENIPPGTYTLTVTAGPATLPYSQVLQLHAADDQNVPVNLSAPARLTGCVVKEAVDTCPVGTSGLAVSGWVLTLYRVEQYPTTVLATERSHDDGSFSFDTVGAGKYVIEAGPAPDNPVASVQVTVQPGKSVNKVIVVPIP